MNWLSQEEMLTYFYNKFRPVNRMHYIKCSVNSSLLNIILVAAEGLWHLGSLFYHNTQYSKRECLTNLLRCDIPWNRARWTGPHHIWCIYTPCPFFGCEKHTDSSAFGLMISLASVCYGDSRVAKHFLRPHLFLQPIWGWGDLGSLQLPQSTSSPEGAWSLCGYI